MELIKKPIFRYGRLNAGELCKLYRSGDVYIPSADDYTRPSDVQRFIDAVIESPHMYVLGRDARFEAYIFSPSHNSTTFMAHFAVRKDKRGGNTIKSAAEAGKWIFENTTCTAIITYVREDNIQARAAIGQIGLKRIGKTHNTVKFNGEFRDELIFQCTCEDYNDLWGETLGRV